MTDRSDEETDDPHYADRRNFYKVEKWSRDGQRRPRYHEADKQCAIIRRGVLAVGLQCLFMGTFARTGMRRLGPCLAALRVLARSKAPLRHRLIELEIDDYLKNDPLSLARGLERLRVAIHNEETERREGEDWSVAREYVRSLLRRMI
jgi:hypothetical protein